jgi:AraC family ethanolamine operon transcriptional activator
VDHLLINHSFSDIGQINELAHDWDLEFRQMQAGPLAAKLLQQVRPGFHFAVAEFSRCIKQEGIPPLSGRTFGLQRTPGPLEWCGYAVGFDDLLVFHPTAGFTSVSPQGFSVYTLTIPEHIWQQQMHNRLGWLTTDDFEQECVLHGPPDRVARLRRILDCYHRQLASHSGIPRSAQFVSEADCLDALFAVIVDATQHCNHESRMAASGRARVLRRACELIYASGGNSVTLADLCTVSGFSERTVQYAFLDHTGQTQKTFIRSYQLERVRSELRGNVDAEPVSATAARWGFTHMGQFARYYRQQFGELPSETRRKK